MKKIFSIASALMLALSMGMTSCSNDIDEVVTEQAAQQPEMHKLYLSASVPQTPETRSYVEGVAGKEDAINITGWKDGDVIYGLYQIVTDDRGYAKYGPVGKLAFSFNGSTNEFVSDDTSITNDKITYFVYGDFDLTKDDSYYADYGDGDPTIKDMFYLNNPVTVDVANNYANIPMWGAASVNSEGKLTTDMQLAGDMAFLCLHNSSSASIDVRIGIGSQYITSFTDFEFLSYVSPSLYFYWNGCKDTDRTKAAVTTIAAGEKAYLPIMYDTSSIEIKVFIDDEADPFASKQQKAFTPGKIYKLNYTGE